MDTIVVRTVVYEDAETVYAFLIDFPRYANYSKYLTAVSRLQGDGGVDTQYGLRFAWWKLTYTAHSEVVAVEPPREINWRVIKDIDANGAWQIEPREELPEDAPPEVTDACTVSLRIEFDPDSADASVLNLPSLVSISWVLDRAIPLIRNEAERVVQRAVADLEDRNRPVEITIDTESSYL